jgi:hypothetical protein
MDWVFGATPKFTSGKPHPKQTHSNAILVLIIAYVARTAEFSIAIKFIHPKPDCINIPQGD